MKRREFMGVAVSAPVVAVAATAPAAAISRGAMIKYVNIAQSDIVAKNCLMSSGMIVKEALMSALQNIADGITIRKPVVYTPTNTHSRRRGKL